MNSQTEFGNQIKKELQVDEYNNKLFSVSLLPHPKIHGIVQLSWRKYPSITMQGDTLHINLHSLESIKNNIEEGDYTEAIESLELMIDNFKTLQECYETVIKAHGIKRSY